jgi:SAM-dependent methyltransferase
MNRHYAINMAARQERTVSERFNIDRIRRYYERHTRTFVTFGEGGTLGSMHRAVLAPGVVSKAAAFRYVEDQIIAVARPLSSHSRALRVVDLGCGVGGSLCYIAQRIPIEGVGVTLSPTQATLAAQRIAAADLSRQVTVLAGDYTELPHTPDSADVVYAIESFVHATDPASFLRHCARLLRRGGALIICDDFRRDNTAPDADRAIERFRRGWHVNTLLRPADLLAMAAESGLRHDSTSDLSPHVDIGRPRDWIVDALAEPLERLPWRWDRLDPWLGGSALQRCLREGWVGYDFVVFRRS